MEGVRVLQDPITRPEIIAIVEIILERVVGRRRYTGYQHLLRDRDVNVRPDRVGRSDVVAKLGLVQHAVLVGLVVARAQNRPPTRVDIAHTLDDRIVLHPLATAIHRNTLGIQRNHDIVRLGIARHRGLEHPRHTITRLG